MIHYDEAIVFVSLLMIWKGRIRPKAAEIL